jgi:protein SCO1/2
MDTKKISLIAISAALLLGPILFSSIDALRNVPQLQSATVLPNSLELPEFLLQDQDGNAFTRTSLEGHYSLIFFGFTNCPDICPATLQQLAVVRQKLQKSGSELPDIVFITVDPQRDTPEVVRQYVGYFGDGFYGATGDLDELRKLTGKIGIYFEYAEGEGDNYNVNHSVVVAVINEEAEVRAVFSAPHDIDLMVNDLQIIMTIR